VENLDFVSYFKTALLTFEYKPTVVR